MATKIMPVSDLRRQTSSVIKAVREQSDVVYITQHGRPAVVMVDYEEYESMLERLEDAADIASLSASQDEPIQDYDEFLAEMDTLHKISED